MQWARQKGFTIVEPLIVIVVIAILAVITIVAYTGIQARTRESSAKSTLSSVAKKIETYKYNTATTAEEYPASLSDVRVSTSGAL